MLQGIGADHSLKSAGEEVGGVEKRRQALARFQGQRAGEGPGSVHRNDRQRCWQAGSKGSLLPRGRNVGERLGLGRKRTTEEEVSASVLQHYSDQDG